MNINEFIKKQRIVKNTDNIKLYLLKSITELLLMPKHDNLKQVVKYLSILSNSFHINLKISLKTNKITDIETKLLNKTSEIIKNNKGYSILVPEMFKIIIVFAKSKDLQLDF